MTVGHPLSSVALRWGTVLYSTCKIVAFRAIRSEDEWASRPFCRFCTGAFTAHASDSNVAKVVLITSRVRRTAFGGSNVSVVLVGGLWRCCTCAFISLSGWLLLVVLSDRVSQLGVACNRIGLSTIVASEEARSLRETEEHTALLYTSRQPGWVSARYRSILDGIDQSCLSDRLTLKQRVCLVVVRTVDCFSSLLRPKLDLYDDGVCSSVKWGSEPFHHHGAKSATGCRWT